MPMRKYSRKFGIAALIEGPRCTEDRTVVSSETQPLIRRVIRGGSARRSAAGHARALQSSYRGLHSSQTQVAMKFGKLLRRTVDTRMPQWRNYTLGYKQLKQQIKQLEEEKKASDAEDQKQNALIAAQEEKLTTQEVKLMTQDSEIKSLRRSLANVMTKLGMK